VEDEMMLKIYRILLMLQILGTTILGYLFFQITGTIVGFVAGVLVAGHFLVVLNTRNINAENTKILKSLLEEMKKKRQVMESEKTPLIEKKEKS
jgi:hypothetical protein